MPDDQDDPDMDPELLTVEFVAECKRNSDGVLKLVHSQGGISAERMELLQAHFKRIYEASLEACEHRRQLEVRHKSLTESLNGYKGQLEKTAAGSFDDDSLIGTLRRDQMKAENEVALAKERDHLSNLEITEVAHQKEVLEKKLDDIQRINAETYEPQIMALKNDISELEAEVLRSHTNCERQRRERKDASHRVKMLKAKVAELKESHADIQQQVNAMKGAPERMRKQAETRKAVQATLDNEVKRMTAALQEAKTEIGSLQHRMKEATSESDELAFALERGRQNIAAKAKQQDDILRDLEMQKEAAAVFLADRVKVDIQLRTAISNVKHQHDKLMRRNREKDGDMRSIMRQETLLDKARTHLPDLQIMLTDAKRECDRAVESKETLKDEVEAKKQELEIMYATALRAERTNADSTEKAEAALSTRKELEQQVQDCHRAELRLRRETHELSAEKEVKSREHSRAMDKFRTMQQELTIRDLEISELQKNYQEVMAAQKEYGLLYDVVKNERNKHMNMIQASNQAVAEMKEKIKILNNEIEILRNDTQAADKALAKQRLEIKSKYTVRDNLRERVNKESFAQKQKLGKIDQQIAEVDKLNMIINSLEQKMVRLKQAYHDAVQSRNQTGITLVDRNDELCILYEKSNIQQSILKNADLASRARVDDMHILEMQRKALEHDIDVAKRSHVDRTGLEVQLLDLQNELLDARKDTQKLSHELENPSKENTGRWRLVGSAVPDIKQLRVKHDSLSQRLDNKQEQLMEKRMVLQEVARLCTQLKDEVDSGKEDTLSQAKKVNELQGRLKEITRQMMGTVSELSMYQATLLRLNQEKAEREKEVNVAARHLEQGLAPTELAEKEYEDMERRRMQGLLDAQARAEQAALEDAQGPDALSTAVSRPNAYVAPDTGLPKPYGKHAPLRPSEQGSSMRHIRKPEPQELEI